jgi:hypothetical protein
MPIHKQNATIEGRLFQISNVNIYIPGPKVGSAIVCVPKGVRRWQLLQMIGQDVRLIGIVTYINSEPMKIEVEKIERIDEHERV